MAKERISKLQKWILKTTLEKGEKMYEDIGICIQRKHFLYFYFLNKNNTQKTRNKFNVSLSRSIRNLFKKGFIRIFNFERPDLLLRIGFGYEAKMAKLQGALKVLAGQENKEEEQVVDTYERLKEAKREGMVRFRELKSPEEGMIQAVSLTKKGREIVSKC